MDSAAGLEAQLLEEYSKLLDTSTVLAILSDYNLSDATQLKEVRQTLEILEATVNIEEATGFDPSGASGPDTLIDDQEDSAKGEDESASAKSDVRGWRSQTDDTSLNQDMSSLDLEGLDFSEGTWEESPDQAYPSLLNDLDSEDKETVLMGMFPSLKAFDIRWTLKKCKGDVGLAIDELMTQSFLEESGARHRGIDAFEVGHRSRKGKGKGKKKRNTEWYRNQDTSVSPDISTSKWDTGRQDVQFLVDKTGMPMQQISSLYHTSGGSVSTTISTIIEAHKALDIESDDPMVPINAAELRQDYPTIPMSDMEILVQITYPSINNARELAKALASQPTKIYGIKLDIRHAPLDLNPEPAKVKPRAHNAVQPMDRATATTMVSTYHEARNAAFTQAQAAYRKGKSDPLMGGAAAYYSQLGRDFDVRAKSAETAAADALVAAQSTKTELDLHGASVKDAVRISREGVTTWWHELGEGRISGRGIGAGYRIVTGAGRHSEGGRSKLGPAVLKTLLREGWKVEVGSNGGLLVVTGVVSKK